MSQESLVRFSDAIITDAEEKRRAFTEKLKDRKREALKNNKEELLAEYKEYIQRECLGHRSRIGLEISRHRNELRRGLMLKRKEMFDGIFAEVTENIKKYAATSEYIEKIARQLCEAIGEFSSGKTVCIARECDISALAAAVDKEIEFETADSSVLGGFSLRNDDMKLYFDCTLNAKIEKQKELFYANSGLVIE